MPIQQKSHVALLSSSGRVLIVDLQELPVLNKGKGNKLIQLQDNEIVVDMQLLNLSDVIQVVAGQQQLKLKGDDLQKYLGKRAAKGQLLPRGYQKANKLIVQTLI
jgi:topoisomerase-4 subunit A